MKEVKVKIKNYTSGVNVIDNNNLRARILHSMFVALGIFALIYFLLLANMVWNIVERRSLEKETLNLLGKVSELEVKYMEMSNKIDLDLSYKMGYQYVKGEYAVRKSLSLLGKQGSKSKAFVNLKANDEI